MPRKTKKPIDRWLGLGSIVVGISYFWLDKTPTTLIVSLILVFLLLLHPVWNFWWIDQRKSRQFGALFVFISSLLSIGHFFWPLVNPKMEQKPAPAQTIIQPIRQGIAKEPKKSPPLPIKPPKEEERTDTEKNTLENIEKGISELKGMVGETPSLMTISGGTITVGTKSRLNITLEPEDKLTKDNLTAINGGTPGARLSLSVYNPAHVVTVREGPTLHMAYYLFILTNYKSIEFECVTPGVWKEIRRGGA